MCYTYKNTVCITYLYIHCAKHMAFKHHDMELVLRGANCKYKGIIVSYRKALCLYVPSHLSGCHGPIRGHVFKLVLVWKELCRMESFHMHPLRCWHIMQQEDFIEKKHPTWSNSKNKRNNPVQKYTIYSTKSLSNYFGGEDGVDYWDIF